MMYEEEILERANAVLVSKKKASRIRKAARHQIALHRERLKARNAQRDPDMHFKHSIEDSPNNKHIWQQLDVVYEWYSENSWMPELKRPRLFAKYIGITYDSPAREVIKRAFAWCDKYGSPRLNSTWLNWKGIEYDDR